MNGTRLIASIGLAVVVAASAQAGILGGGGSSLGGGLGAMGGRSLSGTGNFNAQGQFETLNARDRAGALQDRTGATLRAAKSRATGGGVRNAKPTAGDTAQRAGNEAAVLKDTGTSLGRSGAERATPAPGAAREPVQSSAASSSQRAVGVTGSAAQSGAHGSAMLGAARRALRPARTD